MQNIEGDDADGLVRETLAVLDDPVFAAAFAPGSRAEVAIVADLAELGPGARVNGRIDRLAVSDDAVLIVDFKTNRPPPTQEADVAPLYATQMALYRAAAAKIFPAKRIVCGLVWTEGPTLMELSNGLLDAEMAVSARALTLGVRVPRFKSSSNPKELPWHPRSRSPTPRFRPTFSTPRSRSWWTSGRSGAARAG